MSKLVSVIIPAYNVAPFIRKCVDSVLRSTYKDIEIILVDDKSTDGTLEICKSYHDPRICLIEANHGGVSAARNIGIDHSKGKYITFIDADDWIAETMIERLVDKAEKENVDITICNAFRALSDGKIVEKPIGSDKLSFKGSEIDQYILGFFTERPRSETFPNGQPWGTLYRASIISSHHLRFNEALDYKEDVLFNLYAAAYSKVIARISTPLYFYNKNNSSSLTNAAFKENMLPRYLLDMENRFVFFETFYKGNPQYAKVINQYIINNFLERIFPACLNEADYKTYKEILSRQYISSAFKHAHVTDFDSEKQIYIQLIADSDSCEGFLFYVLRQKSDEAKRQKKRVNELQFDLDCVHNSVSFRLGRAITWLPRKVRGGARCFQDHGAGYTIRRALYHMGLWKDEELENAINETGCKRTAGKYILGLPNVCRSIAKKALMLHPGDIRAAKERYRKAKKRIAVCAFEDFHFAVIENEIRICNLEQNYIIAYVSPRAKKEVSKMLGNKSSLIEWHSYDEPNLPLLQSFNSAEEDLRRQFVQHVISRQNLDYTIIPSAEYHPDWYLPLIEGTRHYELIVGAHNINSIFFSDQAPEKKRRLFEKADSYCVLSSDLKETMLSGGITQKKIYVFDQYYDSAEHTINPVLTDRLSFVITGGVEDKRKDYQSVVDALRMVPDIHPKIRLILLGKATTQYAREIVSQLDKMKETGLNAVTYSNYVPEESFSEIMTDTDYLLGPVVVETTFHGVPETYGTTKLSGMLPDMIKYAKPAILINDLKIPSNMESSVIRYSSVTELAELFRVLTDKKIAEKYAERARANSEQYKLENMLWDRQ